MGELSISYAARFADKIGKRPLGSNRYASKGSSEDFQLLRFDFIINLYPILPQQSGGDSLPGNSFAGKAAVIYETAAAGGAVFLENGGGDSFLKA